MTKGCRNCSAWTFSDLERYCGTCGEINRNIVPRLCDESQEDIRDALDEGECLGYILKLDREPDSDAVIYLRQFGDTAKNTITRPLDGIYEFEEDSDDVVATIDLQDKISAINEAGRYHYWFGWMDEPMRKDVPDFARVLQRNISRPKVTAVRREIGVSRFQQRIDLPVELTPEDAFIVSKVELKFRPTMARNSIWNPYSTISKPKLLNPAPFCLTGGKTEFISFLLDQDLRDAFEKLSQNIELVLSLEVGSDGFQLKDRVEIGFLLTPVAAPQPRVYLSEQRLNALSGRITRLPILLENSGGGNISLNTCQVKIFSLESEECVKTWHDLPIEKGRGLDAGEQYLSELRIPLIADGSEQPLDPGEYKVEVTCDMRMYLDQHVQRHSVTSLGRLQVLPESSQFEGQVCIDFGTTESGAAYYKNDGHVQPISLLTQSLLLPNGLVQGRAFLKTELKVLSKVGGQLRINFPRPGRETLADQPGTRVIRDLKWGLGQASQQNIDLRDGSTVAYADLTTAYLKHIKNLIETHPEIAGHVQDIYITKPAIFDKDRSASLIKCYENAGFNVQLMGRGSDRSLISESWSPILALYPKMDNSLDYIRELSPANAEVQFTAAELEGQVIHVLTFDIGGGSGDFSLFEINRESVTELNAQTSETLNGRQFTRMIEGVIQASIASKELDQFADFDIPWTTRTFQDESQSHNWSEINKLVQYVQLNTGLMGIINLNTAGALFEASGGKAADKLSEVIKTRIEDALQYDERQQTLDAAPLLTMRQGSRFTQVRLSHDDCLELATRVMLEFHDRYYQEIASILTAVTDRPDTGYVTMSGRGALFPLLEVYIQAHLASKKVKRSGVVRKLSHEMTAKYITSIGGLALVKGYKSGSDLKFKLLSTERCVLFISRGFLSSADCVVDATVIDGPDSTQIYRFVLSGEALEKARNQDFYKLRKVNDNGHPPIDMGEIIPSDEAYQALETSDEIDVWAIMSGDRVIVRIGTFDSSASIETLLKSGYPCEYKA